MQSVNCAQFLNITFLLSACLTVIYAPAPVIGIVTFTSMYMHHDNQMSLTLNSLTLKS